MTATTTTLGDGRAVTSDGGPPSDLVRDGGASRLVWAPADAGTRFAGAWWPRTRDASDELAGLAPLVSAHVGGRVTRVTLNIDAWSPEQPRHLRFGDGVLRLGWFHNL